jgi:hypothetical protein
VDTEACDVKVAMPFAVPYGIFNLLGDDDESMTPEEDLSEPQR